ncbi:MAG: hypothetical protein AB4050_00080 [Synechococcus sp.]
MYYINAAPTFAAISRQVQRWSYLLYGSLRGGDEPIIWYLKDRYGVPYWLIFDPQGDRPIEAQTEADVRQYLARRYMP